MNFETYVSWISNPVQIAFIDLVLGADNAVIIALVCRTLPRRQRLNVMIVGTGAAMLLRLFLTAVAGALMSAPILRLVGGLVLMLIAVGLVDELGKAESGAGDDDGPEDFADPQAATEAFWDAILLVALADGVMSLDNTVALAAVAKGDLLFLVLGLALSVPMLVFGSWLLTELFGTTPWFIRVAMAVLGWVAGDMAVSDPLIADWIRDQAPALAYAGPIAAVVFVLVQSAIYRSRLGRQAVLSPLATAEPAGPSPPPPAVAPARSNNEPMAAEAVAAAAVVGRTDVISAGPGRPEPAVAAGIAADPSEPAPDATAQDEPPEASAGPITASTPAASATPAEPAQQGQHGEDRMMFVGLFILFAVAAVLISGAIIVGGATF
ncbi:MAG: YjbE family putative metal transport protein [Ancalomicrobiaceae bacterium]|nr:YjbE family putative metal transport protein [Ancalomicrobiaceae bacterium]